VKQIRKRLTYANVMSTIAVFFVIGGASALAANELAKNSVGTPQLKGNAVTTGKIKKEAVAAAKIKNGAVIESKLGAAAVTNSKLADNAVNSSKIANGAVTNGKLADSVVSTEKIVNSAVTSAKLGADSVTTGKIANSAIGATQLTESERSQAFVSAVSAGTKEVANGLFGSYTPAQSVTSLTLPAGMYVVTAKSEFVNSDTALEYTSIHPVICRLLDGGAEIAEQSATVQPGLLVPTGGVTAVGISDGGVLDLACRGGGPAAKLFAYQAQIIATRVGAVTGP
jgi:hypothetical protein